MLELAGAPFTTGRAIFSDQPEGAPGQTAKIYVKVQLGDVIHLAQLDTGAAYSVLTPEVAGTLNIETLQQEIKMETPLGKKSGPLVRTTAILIADAGQSLQLEAVFFVPQDWPPGKLFLGYTGFVEHIRIGLDPGANHFYFGPQS